MMSVGRNFRAVHENEKVLLALSYDNCTLSNNSVKTKKTARKPYGMVFAVANPRCVDFVDLPESYSVLIFSDCYSRYSGERALIHRIKYLWRMRFPQFTEFIICSLFGKHRGHRQSAELMSATFRFVRKLL